MNWRRGFFRLWIVGAAIFTNRAPKTILGTLQCRMMRQ